MSKLHGIYKCSICGNVVSVMVEGGGTLVCCGKDMDLQEEKTGEQEGNEKHVPVVTVESGQITVNVGSVDHPMEQDHYIVLIQLVKDDEVIAGKRLKPGDKPNATFCLDNVECVKARIFCNLHGVWVN